MAVYKRSYRVYSGDLTPAWSRFLILHRYAKQSLFRSRLQTGFFVLCFVFPLLCVLAIYLRHNVSFFARYGLDPERFVAIDNLFFFYFIEVQGTLAFLFTSFAGPGLISPDLAHGALPLYLCRPFSRLEYVLGKMSVLAILLSQITWIPGLLLFTVQACLAGPRWWADNLWIAGSLVLASWLWIAILSLLATALSAWVKWRIVAGALLLGVFFLGAGFGRAINAVMRTRAGDAVDIVSLMATVWAHLFRIPCNCSPSWGEAWSVLLVLCGLCLLLLLRKVRAYEVIK